MTFLQILPYYFRFQRSFLQEELRHVEQALLKIELEMLKVRAELQSSQAIVGAHFVAENSKQMHGCYCFYHCVYEVGTKLILDNCLVRLNRFLQRVGLHVVEESNKPRGVLCRRSQVIWHTKLHNMQFAYQIFCRITIFVKTVIDLQFHLICQKYTENVRFQVQSPTYRLSSKLFMKILTTFKAVFMFLIIISGTPTITVPSITSGVVQFQSLLLWPVPPNRSLILPSLCYQQLNLIVTRSYSSLLQQVSKRVAKNCSKNP